MLLVGRQARVLRPAGRQFTQCSGGDDFVCTRFADRCSPEIETDFVLGSDTSQECFNFCESEGDYQFFELTRTGRETRRCKCYDKCLQFAFDEFLARGRFAIGRTSCDGSDIPQFCNDETMFESCLTGSTCVSTDTFPLNAPSTEQECANECFSMLADDGSPFLFFQWDLSSGCRCSVSCAETNVDATTSIYVISDFGTKCCDVGDDDECDDPKGKQTTRDLVRSPESGGARKRLTRRVVANGEKHAEMMNRRQSKRRRHGRRTVDLL
ncbi:MAG: hypothetical protein SGARI_000977 [Bacillariaceae sp.]